jgi:type IV pilus biogenesis protein CpaD/CtpE
MKTVIVTFTAVSLLAVAGCSTQRPIGRDFGNATKQNFAVQIVNPEVSTKAPTYDGTHTNNAVVRYREGQTTEPEAEATSQGN